ncbi:MAG: hypothetical protein IKV85_11210 [Ruminococcus sp.]|nr:hypothetical protein [Ruminococcus sp.]
MKLLEKFREKYMSSNLFLAVLAGIIAVLLWLFISLTQYPSVQKTVYHIPVTTNITGSTASQNGLSVTSCDVEEVTVEILGSRTQIGYLTNETLTAYFDADNVSTVETKKLPLKIKSESGIKYEVKSISPSKATVVFDKMDTREFDVVPLTPNVQIVEGKVKNPDEYKCIPSRISITGPSTKLDMIDKCFAVSNKEMSLDTSYVLSGAELKLYTKENAAIDLEKSALEISTSTFDINIAVRTQKKVGLTASIAYAPENFNKDTIKFRLSTDSVTLACNNSQVEIPDVLDVGLIPLYEIRSGFSRTFSIEKRLENTELINVSDLESVVVTIDDTDLEEIPMTISSDHIQISNLPDNVYDYSIITPQIDVTIIGSAESLAEITAEDIFGEVNLLNTTITEEQFNQGVIFSCPSFDDVWIATNAKVTIERTKAEKTTSSTSRLP